MGSSCSKPTVNIYSRSNVILASLEAHSKESAGTHRLLTGTPIISNIGVKATGAFTGTGETLSAVGAAGDGSG